MNINLMPVEFIRRRFIRKNLIIWSVVWGLCLATISVVLLPKYNEYQALYQDYNSLVEKNDSLHRTHRLTAGMKEKLVTLEKEQTQLEKLLPDENALGSIAYITKCVQQVKGKMQLQRFSFSTTQVETPVAAGATRSRSASKEPQFTQQTAVTLQGIAVDDNSVAQFVESMKQGGIFNQVDLKSCSDFKIGEIEGRQFQLECRF